jgi:hypothetical protein
MTRNRVNTLLRSRVSNVANMQRAMARRLKLRLSAISHRRCKAPEPSANKDERGLRMTERSEKRRTGDALVSRADEGRGTLRKASGSRVQATSR